jgi:DNA-directed RNA polymerase subunit RPC12/RpoP
MDGPQPEYRCEACGKILSARVLVCNRWGDPACPDCHSPRLVRHRSKLSAAVAAYFIFNVF